MRFQSSLWHSKTMFSRSVWPLLVVLFLQLGARGEEAVRRYPSPDGKLVAVTKTVTDEDAGSLLSVEGPDNKKVPVWKSYRPVSVHWSADGKYLAVEDYVAKVCTAVLVFEIGEKPKLVYQTPYSDSEYRLAFFFEGWTEVGSIQIKVIDQDSHQQLLSYRQDLVKGRPDAHPNIYKDQGYGLQ